MIIRYSLFVVYALLVTAALIIVDCSVVRNRVEQTAGSVRTKTGRNPEWAVPVEKPGLPNLHRVSDHLYRGAQPAAEGMEELRKMGVRTVVNLRSFHSDRDEIGTTGLAYEHIYMKAWHPEEKEIIRFLQITADRSRSPVFVHCQHGADRTGVMCAVYRIAIQGWTKEEAVKEMTEGGYGFHSIWKNLITYVMELDIKTIMRKAKLR